MVPWRSVLIFATFIAKFFFLTELSYLHPDEFYQSFQIIYNKDIPWEVADKLNINRSIFPLLITHFPVIKINEFLNLGLQNHQIYILVKLNYLLVTWLTVDYCIYKILPTKYERNKALLFNSLSFVTLVFQSHTFSNSLETCLLLPTLYILNELRKSNESHHFKVSQMKLALLGTFISIGIFNRITFPAWILLPSVLILPKFLLRNPISSAIPIVSFIAMSLIIVLVDTHYYQTPAYTIAPWNNLMYNINTDNLSNHGLHPHYNHVLVNYSQIALPLVPLLPPFNNKYLKTTTYLSFLSGILLLSLFPHQELRFLTAAMPLLASSISFNGKFTKYNRYVLKIWIGFNLLLSIFYGIFHQGGIVPATIRLSEASEQSTAIWWHTYPPPTWMLPGNINSVDLMGASIEELDKAIKQNKPKYVITPKNSRFENEAFEECWSTIYHLNLDNLDFETEGIKTLQPGLVIYKSII